MITFFEEPKPDTFDTSEIRYYIYQEEVAPTTGRRHWQGYFEFMKGITVKSAKRFLHDDTIHCEIRRGSQLQAIKYCSKTESKVGKEVEWGKRGEMGDRTDLRDLIEAARWMPLYRLVDVYGSNALRHINMLGRYQQSRVMPTPCDKLMDVVYEEKLEMQKLIKDCNNIIQCLEESDPQKCLTDDVEAFEESTKEPDVDHS